jgi:hypothetical protein
MVVCSDMAEQIITPNKAAQQLLFKWARATADPTATTKGTAFTGEDFLEMQQLLQKHAPAVWGLVAYIHSQHG